MILADAQKILAGVLHSCSYDQFFENIVGRKPLALLDGDVTNRHLMLGENSKQTILNDFEKFAPNLTCHIHTPTVPPPSPHAVADANAFQALVSEYHRRGYTVRIPDVLNLSSRLNEFTRALELIFEKPAGVVIFWSGNRATAPIHHDEIDVIIIQLLGTKKWYISDEPAKLSNNWKVVGEKPPEMGRYSTYDVKPGDLLYLPRGTAHTVESNDESIHLAIGFVPVTIRDAINSILDHLSDLDKPLRAELGFRADNLAQNTGAELILRQIREGLEKLNQRAQSDKFIEDALAYRRARMVYELPKTPRSTAQNATSTRQTVRHSSLAIANLIATPDTLDFRQPGEQILIHLGVEECMRFMLNTPEFKIEELPGEVSDEVKIALTNRMLSSGFLELVQ